MKIPGLCLPDDAADRTIPQDRKHRQRGGNVLEKRRTIGKRERLGGCHDGG
jgi:hypothetical protein